jgi:uncharacterized integral membrane protein
MKSKFPIFRFAFTLIILALIFIIAWQNIRPVELDILWWTGEFSMVLLLLGIGIGSAIVTFIWTLWSQRK